ncbi:uncharacterized protein LOC118477281 [Aplysia californica]|uniref:Uncharacterized protein LOC118477281 n=1 Tax=Aplysia californica TaxID=6500 RepID=A0ABM1VPF3_APLCA|nr:uncharacterized protein LOC118477281 [Aplysia californica]
MVSRLTRQLNARIPDVAFTGGDNDPRALIKLCLRGGRVLEVLLGFTAAVVTQVGICLKGLHQELNDLFMSVDGSQVERCVTPVRSLIHADPRLVGDEFDHFRLATFGRPV